MIERSDNNSLSPCALYKHEKALDRISKTLKVVNFRGVVTISIGHNKNENRICNIWGTNKRC